MIATGEKWVGYGTRTISSAVDEIINGAEVSLSLTIFAISDRGIVEGIKRALERGVTVEVFIYYPEDPAFVGSSKEMVSMDSLYSNLSIHKIRNEVLHAKVIIGDGKRVVVSSANATHAGMFTNYELGVMIDDQDVAYQILEVLRKLVP